MNEWLDHHFTLHHLNRLALLNQIFRGSNWSYTFLNMALIIMRDLVVIAVVVLVIFPYDLRSSFTHSLFIFYLNNLILSK